MDISTIREKIYDFFQESSACQEFFFQDEQSERYSSYYTSMYLIQDTLEALYVHRNKGFSENAHIAYIEIWGVLQAIFIQQDAISELYLSIYDSKLDTKELICWSEVRNLRNVCSGHPSRKDRPGSEPLTRTFMARDFGDYQNFRYEKWQSLDSLSHSEVNLAELIDKYENEVVGVLENILSKMKVGWPC